MDKDGMYHVAALDQGQPVAYPEIISSRPIRPSRPKLQSQGRRAIIARRR